jgi:outer membrane protein OmpA-like peptidoglycan-associated protein
MAASQRAASRQGDPMSSPTASPPGLIVTLAYVALAATSCSSSLAFSDTASIVVAGHPPAPPPPPPPAAPEPPKRVEVQQDQIVIREKIQFETDQAVIKPESFDLLNEITSVVTANPQLKRLSIEGHTDSTGSDKYNQKLSDKRAAAVRTYLVEHGIAPERLVSKGWGEAKPLADNASEAGREQNRRVEFIIVEQDVVQRTYEIDPKTGERRELPSTPKATESNAPQGGKP